MVVVGGGQASNMVGSVKRREPEWIFGYFLMNDFDPRSLLFSRPT